MTAVDTVTLDEVDWALLAELQADARLSWTELGRRVGLSPPAVAERVRRLEDAGVIRGYRATVDVAAVGRPLTAFVRARASGERAFAGLTAAMESRPEVLECHRITGDDCYLAKVAVATVAELEDLLEELMHHGPTTTAIVLSSTVTQRPLPRPAAGASVDARFG